MITPRPSINETLKPACPMYPFFGVEPVLLDDKVGVVQSYHICFIMVMNTIFPDCPDKLFLILSYNF